MQLCRPYIYYGLAVAIAANLCIAQLSRAEIAYAYMLPVGQFGATLALILFAVHRYQPGFAARPVLLRAVSLLIEAMVLLILLVLAFRVMDHITKIGAPAYADDWLAAADMTLGADWIGYFEWIHDRPNLHLPLRVFYDEINLATAAVVVGFVLLGRLDRVRLFVEAFVICAAISIVFGAFLPARAAVDYWVQNPENYQNFSILPGIYHIEILEYLRQPGQIVIGNGSLPGLVTFPSLHTAIGILIVGVCWRTPLAVPAVIYSVVMIAATPIWGGHYFVDLIGGTVMALAVMAVLARSPAFSGIFKTSAGPAMAKA